MEHAGFTAGDLEIRRRRDGSRRLKGRFPYNRKAVLSSGGRNGRPKKEQFASKAFAYRVDKADENIHLLVGHDYGKPLASKETGTLTLTDSDEALLFEAIITPQIADTSHGRDALALLDSGLAVGLSPGFVIPPKRAVPEAEKFEDEGMDPSRGMYNAQIRTILAALLYELSIVTRPAYDEATVHTDDLGNVVDENGNIVEDNKRNWQMTESGLAVPSYHWSSRWR